VLKISRLTVLPLIALTVALVLQSRVVADDRASVVIRDIAVLDPSVSRTTMSR
jgi:hypothetical protein